MPCTPRGARAGNPARLLVYGTSALRDVVESPSKRSISTISMPAVVGRLAATVGHASNDASLFVRLNFGRSGVALDARHQCAACRRGISVKTIDLNYFDASSGSGVVWVLSPQPVIMLPTMRVCLCGSTSADLVWRSMHGTSALRAGVASPSKRSISTISMPAAVAVVCHSPSRRR